MFAILSELLTDRKVLRWLPLHSAVPVRFTELKPVRFKESSFIRRKGYVCMTSVCDCLYICNILFQSWERRNVFIVIITNKKKTCTRIEKSVGQVPQVKCMPKMLTLEGCGYVRICTYVCEFQIVNNCKKYCTLRMVLGSCQEMLVELNGHTPY